MRGILDHLEGYPSNLGLGFSLYQSFIFNFLGRDFSVVEKKEITSNNKYERSCNKIHV